MACWRFSLDSRQEQLAADCIVCFRRQAKLIVTYAHMMTHILAMCPSTEDIWRTTKSIPYYVLRALHAWDLSDSEEKERMIERWKRREICDLSAMPCFVYLCVLSEVLRKQYGAWHAGETWHALIVLDVCETCPCLVFALLEAWMMRLVTNNRITEIQWLLVKINPYYAEGPRAKKSQGASGTLTV